MPSNKERLFQDHICTFLRDTHGYEAIKDRQSNPFAIKTDRKQDWHIIDSDLIEFIKVTQADEYAELENLYHSDTDSQIIKVLREQVSKKPMWHVMRNGLNVKGITFKLYAQKPRSYTSDTQETNYKQNKFSYHDEHYYNANTKERIDLVIWLNGLPIIVIELKHEDEGQSVDDAIQKDFLGRDLNDQIYKLPFLYIALSNVEAKIATDPSSYDNFRWFNAGLYNQSETEGEYPVEHVYRHALSPENITKYLEHYLLLVEPKSEHGKQISDGFTIFPRYHQHRTCQNLAKDVLDNSEQRLNLPERLGDKYLINHSAGSGKTLTMAWMADQLDSLYTSDNQKVFDNIIILTDRTALDKNITDDLKLFSHLSKKINFAKSSTQLAKFLEKDRDIIVSTIHKFSYIQDKLQSDESLRNRKVAFLIDEAHRSQDGKLSLTMRQFFNDSDTSDDLNEAKAEQAETKAVDEFEKLNISNQIFVAFTATTTPKTVAFFGEPFDVYTEEEAITEGYILDVASNIIAYKTMYHLQNKSLARTTDEYPVAVLKKLMQNIAFEDDEIIQYKANIIVDLFEKKTLHSIQGKGKAMVVASSRLAGLKYYNHLKKILKEKGLNVGVLYAFSDFTHPNTKEKIQENKLNELGKATIEDEFEKPRNRILVVANKFQTGFDQPLLSSMFLDKVVNGVNAVQTVSRLNRKHPDKQQSEILVVDFTNNTANIFDAFNKHRKGSPYQQTEPTREVLEALYKEVVDKNVFTEQQIVEYVKAYQEAENKASQDQSALDAILSNINIRYKKIVEQKLPNLEDRREYVSLLSRYKKQFYFIASFYQLDQHFKTLCSFVEAVELSLFKNNSESQIKRILENIKLVRGAVPYLGEKVNEVVSKPPSPKPQPHPKPKSGQSGGMKKATIDDALDDIKDKFDISDDEAIVIREVFETVLKESIHRETVIANKSDEYYLSTRAKPNIHDEVYDVYDSKYEEKLYEAMYTEQGGIIDLISVAVIDDFIKDAA